MTGLDLAQDPQPPQQPANKWMAAVPKPVNKWAGVLEPLGAMRAEEAQSATEWGTWFGARIAKSAADSVAHLGNLAFKLSGAVNPFSSYDANAQILKGLTGSADPGAVDYLGALAGHKDAWVYDPITETGNKMSMGQAADVLMQKRLGKAAVVADVAGTVMSFAAGPGAALGRVGAKAVAPLAGIAERTIAKSLMKGAGMAPESMQAMLDTGRAMEVIANLPKWKQTISLYDRALMLGGRNARDLLSMAGANVAQSYGLLPDDQRLQGAKLALITAPLAMPIVKIGEVMTQKALVAGMSPEQIKTLGETYRKILDGNLSTREAAKQLNKAIGLGRRIGSDLVASAFEGAAFPLLDPHAHELYDRWKQGDPDAGPELAAVVLGSMAGVAATKFAVPHEQTPMFRAFRPDLNRLETAIQAEAIKRAAQDPPQPVPQEPAKASDREAILKAAVDQTVSGDQQASAMEDYAGRPTEGPDLYSEHLARMDAASQSQYKWADHLSLGLMRATHKQPTLEKDGSVRFDLAPEFAITLRSTDGVPSVEFDPSRVLPVMKDLGRTVDYAEIEAPTRAVIRGEGTKKFLDDLTLATMQRQMQADLDFSRLGLEQVWGRPDLWKHPYGGGDYYTTDIAGDMVALDKLGDGSIRERSNFIIADGFDKPKHQILPAAQELLMQWQAKRTIVPDPLIDGIVGRAITLSMHSDSFGAKQLREFFASADPQQLVGMLNPKDDQILAFQLGSLASGQSIARAALAETQAMVAERQRFTAPDPENAAVKFSAGWAEGVPRTDSEQPTMFSGPETKEGFGSRAVINSGFGEGVPLPDLMERPSRSGEAGFGPGPEMWRELGDRINKRIDQLQEAARRGGKKAVETWRTLTDRMPELLRGKGDDAFVDQMRRANADKGFNIGAEQALSKRAEKLLRKTSKEFRNKIVETEGGPMPMFQAVAEGRKFDAGRQLTQEELSAAAMFRSPFEATREMVREAGGIRRVYNEEAGKALPEPLSTPKAFRVPRTPGPDWADVMNNSAERMDLWKDVIAENGMKARDAETGEMRPMRPEELDAEMLATVQASAVDVPGRQAAVEFKREIQWFPSEWRGKKILETDPYELLKRVPRQQAGRAASLKMFGPDLADWERAHLKETYGIEYGPDRPGVEARLKQAAEKFVKQAPSGEGPDAAQLARNIVTDLEGGLPKDWQFRGPMGKVLRGIFKLDQPVRGALTSLSFLADVGDAMLNHGVLVGRPLKTLSLLADTVVHPIRSVQGIRDAIIQAKRAGMILETQGQHDVLEAKSWWMRWVDAVQWTGTKIENFKIAYFDKWAERMLADWSKGDVTSNDRMVLGEMMKFPAADQDALLTGKADPQLQAAFRREFVQLATSRRPIGEGSAATATPWIRSLLRFTNWASGNLFKLARAYKAAGKDVVFGAKDLDAVRAGRGVYRGLKTTGLITGAGLISKMMAYTVAGMFRDENGWNRFWNELAYSLSDPTLAAKYLGRTFAGQTLGGPASQLVNALTGPDDAKTWANLTTPGAWWYAISRAFQQTPLTPAAPLVLAKNLALESGVIPLGNHLRQSVLASGALAGAEPRTKETMKMAWAWARMEGVDNPRFERTKPEEFYKAMANVRRAINDNPKDIGAALKQAEGDLRTALNLAGEESVAATIRGYQFLSHVPKDKLDRFADYMGEERMQFINAHDQSLRAFAKVLGLAHGENPTPFEKELETAERMAKTGGATMWRSLVDRAMDDAEVRLEAGQDIGEDVRDLAESMAAFPEQQDWLSERQLRAVARPSLSYSGRVRLLESILRQRARAGSKDAKKQLRKLRRQGIDLAPLRQEKL